MDTPEKLFEGTRLRFMEHEALGGMAEGWHRATVEFEYMNLKGESQAAKGLVLLPQSVLGEPGGKVPLYFMAGYQLGHGTSALTFGKLLERNWVIVNPITQAPDEVWPGENPTSRGVGLDVALLHAARSLPFVDSSKVIITGQSSGGLMTFMLGAESFPVAGIAPDVALVDLGYMYAYIRNTQPIATWPNGNPNFAHVIGIFTQVEQVIGSDVAGKAWWDESALGHVDEITCPVNAAWSTADLLVPIDQVGLELALPYDASQFPPDFTRDAKQLLGVSERATLMDLLPKDEVSVLRVEVPKGAEIRPGAAIPPPDWQWVTIPDSDSRWTIVVLDEGPIEPWVDHIKYASLFSREAFFNRCLSTDAGAGQLTDAKLERLMDRVGGIESYSHGVPHLDFPEYEHSDVILGLKAFAQVPGNAQRLIESYERLDPSRQLLGSGQELKDLLEIS